MADVRQSLDRGLAGSGGSPRRILRPASPERKRIGHRQPGKKAELGFRSTHRFARQQGRRGVHDGDTITVYTGTGPQFKVRLQGIDAPELKQPFGKVAKQPLSEMIFGRSVDLLVQGEGRYGRILATVIVDRMNVNLAMLQSGFAWHYKAYSKDAAFAAAEQEARTNRRGLWVKLGWWLLGISGGADQNEPQRAASRQWASPSADRANQNHQPLAIGIPFPQVAV